MDNFRINLESPWLLLVLIPAIALVLYTFLRVNKRFRYTRNRIISLIASLVSVALCALMLAGISFSYDKHNDNNEVMLVVDSSYSNLENKNKKDDFVKEVIDNNPKNVSLGIVTFGYEPVYALELTNDMSDAYNSYLKSDEVDTSSTNIEGALMFAGSKLKHKKTAKLILLTDGIETDGNALRAINNLSIEGVRVDCVDFNNQSMKNDLMLKEVKTPEHAIRINEGISLELIIESNIRVDSEIKVYDNNELIHHEYSSINKGLNSIIINHSFTTTGLHELKFEAISSEDRVNENNILYSFINIEVVDKILILDRANEADAIIPILNSKYSVTALNIKDAPMDINLLREYDQIILDNIANSDMNEGFIDILNSYVKDYGGGLLTIGGYKDSSGNLANTYNRADMENTLYQEMLPVLAEDYTPPVAVMIVLDTSGSMGNPFPGSTNSLTMMDEARESAKATLNSLDSRDYLGVVTFGATATMVLEPTPVAKKAEIETAIGRITEKMSSTVYSTGLEKAGLALKSLTGVNKKHIILISDGAPSAGDTEYVNKTIDNYNSGVTTSVVSLGGTQIEQMGLIAEAGHGRVYHAKSGEALTEAIKKDIAAPEIREFQMKSFKPSIKDGGIIFNGIRAEDIPSLDGFFGTKLRKGAKAHLVGEYGEPIYASWKYGSGMVGSFMCDLNGIYSSSFINNEVGKLLINNIVGSLFPIEPIRSYDIDLKLERANYTLRINVHANLADKEKIKLNIYKIINNKREAFDVIILDSFKNSITKELELREPGIYEVEAIRLDSKDDELSRRNAYQDMSYSMEYNQFLNNRDNHSTLLELAHEGGGELISKPNEVFNNLVMSFHKEYDPRYILAGAVIACLLLDLAVSKFKFKWPHELIRDARRRKND